MKCLKCGAELSEDTKFCSYCGTKVEAQTEIPPIPSEIEKADESKSEEKYTYPNNTVNNASVTSKPTNNADKIKAKFLGIWNKLSKFGKFATISIMVFVILGLVAFLAGRIFAGIIAGVQIAIAVAAILMKKQIIKVPKTWIPLVVIVFSLVLMVPYFSLFKVNIADYEKYEWDEVVLADMLPKPKSPYGELILNSEDYLALDVTKTSEEQYDKYIEECKNNGFTIDAETKGSFFYAYNDKGYKLSLNYYDDKMHIGLEGAMELGTLTWSDSEMAKLLPNPKSTIGNIQQDDEKGFVAYIGETTIEEYNAYVEACQGKGFNVDVNKTEKLYSAKNEDSYKLSVEYKGNNVICISVAEPEYDVSIEIECVKNLIFSKYDVETYIDGEHKGTISHGDKETYSVVLTKGKHTISFRSAENDTLDGKIDVDISKSETLKLKIYCSSSGIEIDSIAGTTETENLEESKSTENGSQTIVVTMSEDEFIGMNYTDAETKLRDMGFTVFEYEILEAEDVNKPDDTIGAVEIKNWEFGKGDFAVGDTYGTDAIVVLWYYVCDESEPNLTVENCPEFAAILTNKAEIDESYSSFATKYTGRIIEFDGRIDYCTKHENYNTRFDYLVSAGDYDADHQIGPTFKFEDVNYSDLNTDLETVSVGLNVHIVAEVKSFDSNSGLFYLEPVAVTKR